MCSPAETRQFGRNNKIYLVKFINFTDLKPSIEALLGLFSELPVEPAVGDASGYIAPRPLATNLSVKVAVTFMNTIIQAQDVHFRYEEAGQGSPLVLDGVSLEIRQGEFLAVLGHNGSGKSTLAKHFNAILLPMGGKVYVKGMDTQDEERLYDIRQQVGMVFQNPDNQIVATIVEEDVAFGLENIGVAPEEIRRRVDEALKAVGMYEYREHAPHQLSGGQKTVL